MANLKNITELPMAESADGLNLIVNDNGVAKQMPASAVSVQADFSVTDETNPAFIKNKPEVVQADWAEMDESSPAFIKNKPEAGGGSTVGPDIEFFLKNEQVEVLIGSYEDIYNKLLNKEPVYAVLTAYYNDGSPSMWNQYYAQTIFIPDYEGGLITFYFVDPNYSGIALKEIRYNSDGSVEHNSRYCELVFQ